MISVVIPAYNEEKLISKCLDSLVRQKTLQKFEVIVVDNSSTDKTREIANSYQNIKTFVSYFYLKNATKKVCDIR